LAAGMSFANGTANARVRTASSAGRTPVAAGWFATTRSAEVGPEARPVAIPGHFDASHALSGGVVEVLLRVRWSGPPRTYDLADRQDRILVYEQVMAEGHRRRRAPVHRRRGGRGVA
jgi:hypothetical protein